MAVVVSVSASVMASVAVAWWRAVVAATGAVDRCWGDIDRRWCHIDRCLRHDDHLWRWLVVPAIADLHLHAWLRCVIAAGIDPNRPLDIACLGGAGQAPCDQAHRAKQQGFARLKE